MGESEVQNKSYACKKGRSEEAREVRNGMLQVPYCYPGQEVWVWAAAKGHEFMTQSGS